MILDAKLIELSHLAPERSATVVILAYYDLVGHYRVEEETALRYLQYKYTTEKPKPFVAWYTSADFLNVTKKDKLFKPQTRDNNYVL